MLSRDEHECYRDVVRGAVVCDGAAGGIWFGLSRDKRAFRIEAHYGATPATLAFAETLRPGDGSASGTSILERRRIVIRDVREDYADRHSKGALAAGIRAVTSTPLIDSRFRAVGVIALYHATPNHPSYSVSAQLDACCQVAAKLYEVFARDNASTLSPAARQAADAVARLLPSCGQAATKESIYCTLIRHLDIVLRGMPATPA